VLILPGNLTGRPAFAVSLSPKAGEIRSPRLISEKLWHYWFRCTKAVEQAPRSQHGQRPENSYSILGTISKDRVSSSSLQFSSVAKFDGFSL